MILYCIGCGKPSPDKDWRATIAHISPTCLECVTKPAVRELVSAMRSRQPAQSELVRIHEDCYVDAAAVVAVEAFCDTVAVAWNNPTTGLATRIFRDHSDPKRLAREIMQRVNTGRFTIVPATSNQSPADAIEALHQANAKGSSRRWRIYRVESGVLGFSPPHGKILEVRQVGEWDYYQVESETFDVVPDGDLIPTFARRDGRWAHFMNAVFRADGHISAVAAGTAVPLLDESGVQIGVVGDMRQHDGALVCTCPAADMLADGWRCTCGAK